MVEARHGPRPAGEALAPNLVTRKICVEHLDRHFNLALLIERFPYHGKAAAPDHLEKRPSPQRIALTEPSALTQLAADLQDALTDGTCRRACRGESLPSRPLAFEFFDERARVTVAIG